MGSYRDRLGSAGEGVYMFFKDSVLVAAGVGSLMASLFLNSVISKKSQNCLVISIAVSLVCVPRVLSIISGFNIAEVNGGQGCGIRALPEVLLQLEREACLED